MPSAGPKPLAASFICPNAPPSIWLSSGCILPLCSPSIGLLRRDISQASGKLWTNFCLSTSFLHPPPSLFPSLPPSQGCCCCLLLPPPPSLNLQRDWKEAELISRLKLLRFAAPNSLQHRPLARSHTFQPFPLESFTQSPSSRSLILFRCFLYPCGWCWELLYLTACPSGSAPCSSSRQSYGYPTRASTAR